MQSNASQSSLRGPPEIFVTAEDGSCKTERPVENSPDPATVSLNDVGPAIMVTDTTSGIDTPASTSLNDIVGDPANLAGDSRNSKVVSTSGTSLDSTEDAKSGRCVSPVGVKTAKLKDGTGSGSGSGDQFAKESGKSRSTFHGSHLSLSQNEQERLLWGMGITSKHLLFASVAAASAALIASLPMAPLYEEGRKYEAFGLFVAACWFIGPALGVTCTVWMRKMNDLPTRWISLEAWLPGVMYTITACSVYVVLMALGLWPLPMLPIIGACTFAGPVFITIYLQLPEAIKSQPGYLMTYAKMVLVAAAMNAYWFILLIFYFLFSYIRNAPIGDGLSSALQIILTVAFKLISVACCHLRSHLAHHAMKGQKTSAIFRISILSEFEIDAACELYQALVLPDVQGVEVFIALLIIEGVSLAYVLTRDPRVSLIDSALPFIRKISIATVPPIDQSLTPTPKASVASKQEKEKDRRARILILQSQIFFMECVAKLFGSLTFVVMTPIMYYGPNKNWMSFSYTENALAMGIAYTGISVAVLFVHLLLGFIYVKHKANTNLIARGLELLDDHMFQLMVCMYFFIPVLLTTHIGKQWNTITFLDQVFKRQ